MKLLPVTALLALGLVGCAAAPDLPAGHAMDTSREEGVAIVSLALGGKPLDKMESFAYRIREVPPRGTSNATVTHRYDSPRQQARAIWDADKDHPFAGEIVVKGLASTEPLDIRDGAKPVGRLAVLRLTPGDYEIHAWRLRESVPGGTTEYAPPRDFSYRFSIKSGEAIYLGRLELRFGEHNAQRIAIENRWQEDMALLGRKHPMLDAGKVVPSVGSL